MSRRLVRFLTCDNPRCITRFVHTIGVRLAPLTVLRHEARAAGWTEKNGKDYCPQHKPWPGLTSWALAGTEAAR